MSHSDAPRQTTASPTDVAPARAATTGGQAPVFHGWRRGGLFGVLAALSLGLTACSSATNPGEQSTPTQSSAGSSQSGPADAGESKDEGETEEQTADSQAEESAAPDGSEDSVDTSGWELSSSFDPGIQPEVPAVVSGLRVAEHDGFDRVVLDLTGSGPVGWDAFYTDTVTGQGKGDPLPLEGTVFLNVDVTGVSIPVSDAEWNAYYQGQEVLRGGAVTAWYDSTFEGRAQVAIGLDQPRPFQVFTLTDPLRVIIDVATN